MLRSSVKEGDFKVLSQVAMPAGPWGRHHCLHASMVKSVVELGVHRLALHACMPAALITLWTCDTQRAAFNIACPV